MRNAILGNDLKTIFKEGRKPQYLWVDKGNEFYNKHLKELLDKNKTCIPLRMKKNHLFVKDGIKQKLRCGSRSLFKLIRSI